MMPPKGKSTKSCKGQGKVGVSPVGGGGSLILPYIRRLGPFLVVSHFEFQSIWGVSER